MKPRTPGFWLIVATVGLLALLPMQAYAGMTPEEVKTYNTTSAKARNGDKLAQYNVGVCFSSGLGVKEDPAQAVAWWRKSAAQGFAPAMFNLGFSYMSGIGTKQDLALGASWYRKSADLGHVPAMCNLGICYDDGAGIPANAAEAIKWLGMAAAKGDVAATIRLDLLQSKLATNPAQVTIFRSFKAKAEKGDAIAQFSLGNCYENGNGVAKNLDEAANWWRKAADHGHPNAQCKTGLCYESGIGVPRDFAQAISWYRKAAEQGHAGAQFNLGGRYYNGEGVTKDEIGAYAYWNLVRITDEDARRNLAVLEKQMSAGQIAAGQKRSKELQKEIDAKSAAKKAGK